MSNHKHDKITAPLNVFANAEFENWSSASCSVPPDKMVGCGLSGVPLGPFSSSEQFYEVANSYNLISFVHFSKNRFPANDIRFRGGVREGEVLRCCIFCNTNMFCMIHII